MSDKNIRIDEKDHKWLMETRGSESVKKRVSTVIAKYKEVEYASTPKSTSPQ